MTVAETGLGSTSGKIFKATAVMMSRPRIATNVTSILLTKTLLIDNGDVAGTAAGQCPLSTMADIRKRPLSTHCGHPRPMRRPTYDATNMVFTRLGRVMLHVFCNLEESEGDDLPMCDMTFEVVAREYNRAASSWRLNFRADAAPYPYPVGFAATIPMLGWHEQVDGEGEEAFHSYWGSVTLHSRGQESDALLTLMADYFGFPPYEPARKSMLSKLLGRKDEPATVTRRFADTVQCVAVGIASNPALLEDEAISMKLFLDDGVKNGRYAEIFFNLSLQQGFAALNEKDEEYRGDLMHWLSLPGDVVARPSEVK